MEKVGVPTYCSIALIKITLSGYDNLLANCDFNNKRRHPACNIYSINPTPDEMHEKDVLNPPTFSSVSVAVVAPPSRRVVFGRLRRSCLSGAASARSGPISAREAGLRQWAVAPGCIPMSSDSVEPAAGSLPRSVVSAPEGRDRGDRWNGELWRIID